MADQKLRPAADMALVQFSEEEALAATNYDETGTPENPVKFQFQTAVIGQVLAVGPASKNGMNMPIDAKSGDAVMLHPGNAISSLRVDKDLFLVHGGCIAATLTA